MMYFFFINLDFSQCALTNDIMESDGKHYVTIFVEAEHKGEEEPQNLEPNKCKGWFWIRPQEIEKEYKGRLFQSLQNYLKSCKF